MKNNNLHLKERAQLVWFKLYGREGTEEEIAGVINRTYKLRVLGWVIVITTIIIGVRML